MLSTTSQHALRVLTVLACLPRGSWVLAQRLAEATCAPPKYLSKILVMLAKAGIVEAKRGIGGGYRLARPAHTVSLAEVIHAVEGMNWAKTCLLAGFRACTDEDGCPAHAQFKAIRDAWLAFLSQTTLDVIACRGEGKSGDCLSFWRAERNAAARARESEEPVQR